MKTIYLSGPMAGLPDFNYPLFHQTAAYLRDQAHKVYNPAEFGEKYRANMFEFPIRKAFSEYCNFICNEADAIYMLPGWENSKGANIELSLAKMCGLEVIFHSEVNLNPCNK